MGEQDKSSSRVWSKFSTQKSDGSVLNMYIEDISDETTAGWNELYQDYFLDEEPLQKAAEINKSEDAKAEFNEIKKRFLNDPKLHRVVCCVDTESGIKVIGASAMTKDTSENDLDFETQTKELTKFFGIIRHLESTYDVFVDKNIKTCYSGKGIIVHPDYRRLGVGKELVKTRRLISKEHDVPYTIAWMTSLGTQKASDEDGWETVVDIPYKELEEKFEVVFESAPPTCKLMVARAMQ